MTLAFGNQIEPGGMELEDWVEEYQCPACAAVAQCRVRERVEGEAINPYETITCARCGYESGDDGTP
jgi:hypothetical protein